jgi:hypothetical protein
MRDSKQMKPGEDELNRVFFTTLLQLGKLSNFYSTLLTGLPYGTIKQISEMEATGEELYADGTLASWLKKPAQIDAFYKIMKEQTQQIYKQITEDSKRSLDAVAIVFAHGVLDTSVYGYLEVLSLASPESFRSYTHTKQVTLSEVESKSYDQLHKERIKKFMEGTVERNSLIYKLDKLHEIAKPTDTQMNPKHKYERERLEGFDKARHDIVHGNNWRSYSIDFTQESFYWGLLNFYLLRVVVQKTGLKLSQEGGEKYFLGL